MVDPRRIALIVALALVPAPGLVSGRAPNPQSQEQRPPVFRGGVDLVTVDAYPRRDGRIVEGLRPTDFEVREDDRPQAVEQFEFIRIDPDPLANRRDPNTVSESNALAADPRHRAFVVMLDMYHVSITDSNAVRGPLTEFLSRQLGADDVFAITTPKRPAKGLTFARSTVTIADELDKAWMWGEKESVVIDPNDPEERLVQDCAMATGGGIAAIRGALELYHAERVLASLEDHLDHLGTLRDARTSLILISDGWPAKRGSPGGRPAGNPPVIVRDGRLAIGARPEELDASACAAVMNRLASLDTVARSTSLGRRAQQNNVVFYTVSPGGVYTYSAGRDMTLGDPLMMLSAATDGLTIRGMGPLLRDFHRIADDTSAYYLLGYRSTNSVMDGKRRSIDVRVKGGGVQVVARRGYVATSRAKPAEPSGEKVTAVREAIDRLAKSSTTPIVVAGASSLLGPGAVRYAPSTARSATLQPISGQVVVSRAGRLRVEWPITDTLDRRLARLLDARGQPLPAAVSATEVQSGNSLVLAVDLALAPFAAGDFVLEVVAGRGDQETRQYLAFRIQ